MTYYDVYIGDPDDPEFSWEQGDSEYEHYPNAIDGCPIIYDRDLFYQVSRLVTEGALYGKTLDWGACAAKVRKWQIINLCEKSETKDQKFLSVIDSLDDEKEYAIVIAEF